MPRKAVKKATKRATNGPSSKKAKPEGVKKRTYEFRHYKIPNEAAKALEQMFTNGGGDTAVAFVNSINPGETDITTRHTQWGLRAAANKSGLKAEIKEGLFVLGAGLASLKGYAVTVLERG